MRSFLVIGMGDTGKKLAYGLLSKKNDVMIVDENPELIDPIAQDFTDAQIGDCRNEYVLKSLGVNNFDVCFVTIGENFQSSLEITSLLKETGAKRVISKASSDIQEKFLLRNGADAVFYPERDAVQKLTVLYNTENVFNFIELSLSNPVSNKFCNIANACILLSLAFLPVPIPSLRAITYFPSFSLVLIKLSPETSL